MSALHLHTGFSPEREEFLTDLLQHAGCGDWIASAQQCWQDPQHGDFVDWKKAVQALPACQAQTVQLDVSQPIIGGSDELDSHQKDILHRTLRTLVPWRKGPFSLFGISVDAEWRSDMKWDRLASHINLQDRQILDVGCGNGYYLLRMVGQGARLALGVEPSWLSHWQFAAVTHFLPADFPAWMVPARLETLPKASFDTIFSMGVLHHQKNPQEHLQQLHKFLRPGGELVLETLVCTQTPSSGILPIETRYANMRNVPMLLHPDYIQTQLEKIGFRTSQPIDCTSTTPSEQRSTDWMPFYSLKNALDPADSTRTIEGYPAPLRAIFIAQA